VSTTAPAGFRACGLAAGLKANGAPDLALVVNDGPLLSAAGVFTRNRVKAAPVLWSQQVLKGGELSAVVLNSGGANACTGPLGFQDTHATAEQAATALSSTGQRAHSAAQIAVCSTGHIGERPPIQQLLTGVDAAAGQLAAGAQAGQDAAVAIMTTDSVAKTAAVGGQGYTVGGMAKGAGMLAPGLATMLAVLTTDAVVTPADLELALRAATVTTFDRVDSDGCMSTNDTVLLLASGASNVTPSLAELTATVQAVCAELAAQLVADAEGATKTIAIEVVNATSETDAVTVGRACARSNLLKCALFGQDPNWGRVLSAVGTTDAVFEPDQLSVAINDIWVCRNGTAAADRAQVDLTDRQVRITVDLAAGVHTATVWTNDLTHDYVHENSAYST
jgi:glutamate N-acetyltransferase/amino-acid N-acetyltransferase